MSKKTRKGNKRPQGVDVTLSGETLNITRDEAVNPADWVTLKEFKNIIDGIREKYGFVS